MAIGEIIGFVNSNPKETLDKLINRKFADIPVGGGGLSVSVIPIDLTDNFPFTVNIGSDCIAFVQELINYTYVNRYDNIITDTTTGELTVDVVKPFVGRIVLVRNGGDSS